MYKQIIFEGKLLNDSMDSMSLERASKRNLFLLLVLYIITTIACAFMSHQHHCIYSNISIKILALRRSNKCAQCSSPGPNQNPCKVSLVCINISKRITRACTNFYSTKLPKSSRKILALE